MTPSTAFYDVFLLKINFSKEKLNFGGNFKIQNGEQKNC